MSMANPAYILFGDGIGENVGVRGPDGLVVGYYLPADAKTLVELLNRAFDAGVAHEKRKLAPPVPGPQNPPKKIHPTEVA